MTRRRGTGLSAVILLTTAAFFLMGLALGLAGWYARRETSASRYEHALRYAYNGFQLSLAQLRENEDWKGPLAPLPILPGHPPDAKAKVVFGDATSGKWVSENRRTKDEFITTPSGAKVPGHCVYLASVGSFGGEQAVVEGVISVAEFPFALASSGPLQTSGSFLVGSVDDPGTLDLGMDSPAFQKLLKRGSLLSNASGLAVKLDGSPVNVTGDVVTVGTADVGQAQIGGSVKEHREPKPMPEFDLSKLVDWQGSPGVRVLEKNHLVSPEAFEGYVKASGPVEIDGELKLSEAIVYVDGSLTVRGPMSGRGALFCSGPVRLESSSIGALSQLAIVSGGDLAITGRGKSASRIAGLLVSKGDLSLTGVTVVGCVICAGGTNRVLKLDNVDVFGSPKGTDFEFSLGWGGAKTSYTVSGTAAFGGGGLVRLSQVSGESGEKRPATPADFAGRYDSANPTADLLNPTDFEVVDLDASGHPLLGLDGKEVVKPFAGSGLRFDDPELSSQLLNPMQTTARSQAQTPANGGISQGKLSLDLNKFLKVGETLQVVYRRIH